MSDTYSFSGTMLDDLAEALSGPGYQVCDAALPPALFSALQRDCRDGLHSSFRAAGVGREQQHLVDARVRSDEILWLESVSDAAAAYLACMERLRTALNERLFLGLFDYECHYAHYRPGAAYQTHLDAFAGARSRVLSTVFYLNDDWYAEDGGELVLYAPDDHRTLQKILPQGNRLVVFLSERFPHEVRPAQRDRYSVAGWFRVKGEKSWLRPV
jgi:SM-20-related protein